MSKTGDPFHSRPKEVQLRRRTSYYYPPLADSRSIRLATIYPGEWSDELRCSISCHSLDDKPMPVYTALSYIWGSPRPTNSILVDGALRNITVSLACAMYHLRDSEYPVRLWADALCINQKNPHERGHQVQIMKEIYSGASQTIIFLGDGVNHRPLRGAPPEPNPRKIYFHDDLSDDHLMEKLWDSLAFPKAYPVSPAFRVFSFLRSLSDRDKLPALVSKMAVDTTFTVIIEDLRMMLLSPWWQRIWVLQEVAVSKNLFVRYGNVQAPWDMFLEAAHSLLDQVLLSRSQDNPCIPSDYTKVLQLFTRYTINCSQLREQWQSKSGSGLLDLLQKFSYRRAADERDKVYALLTLVHPSEKDLIEPNYFYGISQVYRNTTIALIRRSRRLSTWCGDLARKNRGDLLSWVPDWSAVYEESDRRRARTEQLYRASGGWKLNVVDSRTDYWSFTRKNMQRLLDNIARPVHPKKLPFRLIPALNFFHEMIGHHRLDYIAAEKLLRRVQQRYQSYTNELPYQPGTAMKEFHSLHTDLLDTPAETGASRAILKFCHERLWPKSLGFRCNAETCTGHASELPPPRMNSPQSSSHGQEDDHDDLFGLVEISKRQFSKREELCREYLMRCREDMAAVQSLCRQLRLYCTDLEPGPLRPWVRRLFSQSALLYGSSDPLKDIVDFRNPEGSPSTPPKLESKPTALMPLHLPVLNPTSEISTLLSASDSNSGGGDIISANRGSSPILSIESERAGVVQKVLGPKLHTWSNKSLACGTIRAWLEKINMRKDRNTISELVVARALVADSRGSGCTLSDLPTPYAPIRRLQPQDHVSLMGWFHRSLLPRVGLVWQGESRTFVRTAESTVLVAEPSGSGGVRSDQIFDDALKIATEGRVLFELADGSFGLGPSSMAANDEIHSLPGGNTHFVLRQIPPAEARIDAPSYTIMGDCYVQSIAEGEEPAETDESGEEAPWEGGLPEVMLYTSSLSLPTIWEERIERRRIYLF